MVKDSNTWAMSKAEENVLQRAERERERESYGEYEEWCNVERQEEHRELMSMVGLVEDIVMMMKKSRVRWYRLVLKKTKDDGTIGNC